MAFLAVAVLSHSSRRNVPSVPLRRSNDPSSSLAGSPGCRATVFGFGKSYHSLEVLDNTLHSARSAASTAGVKAGQREGSRVGGERSSSMPAMPPGPWSTIPGSEAMRPRRAGSSPSRRTMRRLRMQSGIDRPTVAERTSSGISSIDFRFGCQTGRRPGHAGLQLGCEFPERHVRGHARHRLSSKERILDSLDALDAILSPHFNRQPSSTNPARSASATWESRLALAHRDTGPERLEQIPDCVWRTRLQGGPERRLCRASIHERL